MGLILCPTSASYPEWRSLAQGVQGRKSHSDCPLVVEVKQGKKEIHWESQNQKLMAFHCCEAGQKQTPIFEFDQSAAKNEENQWVELPHFGLVEKVRGADWLP